MHAGSHDLATSKFQKTDKQYLCTCFTKISHSIRITQVFLTFSGGIFNCLLTLLTCRMMMLAPSTPYAGLCGFKGRPKTANIPEIKRNRAINQHVKLQICIPPNSQMNVDDVESDR